MSKKLFEITEPTQEPASPMAPATCEQTLREVDQLTHEERVDLAVCHYGLYTFGNPPPWDPTSGISYADAKAFHDTDVACSMDNAKVPRYWSECTADQREVLQRLAAMRNKKIPGHDISGKHHDAHEPLFPVGGFKSGELAFIAAPNISGQKKTMFAEAMAREAGLPLAPILLEENPERLKERLVLLYPRNHGKSQSLEQLLAGLREMDPVAMYELTNMHRRGAKASRIAEQITDVVLKDMLQPMDPEQAERKPETAGMVQEIHPPETVIPFEERLEMAVEHWNMRTLKVPPKIRTQMTPAEIDQWVAECTELMDANGVPQRYGQLFEAMMNRTRHQKHYHAPELVDKDIFGLIRRVSKVSKSKRKRK